MISSLTQHPEVDAVMNAVQTISDFTTQAVRNIGAGPSSRGLPTLRGATH